jgi:hypothetical protein
MYMWGRGADHKFLPRALSFPVTLLNAKYALQLIQDSQIRQEPSNLLHILSGTLPTAETSGSLFCVCLPQTEF